MTRVMVVDDDLSTLGLMSRLLQREGFDAVCAPGAAEAQVKLDQMADEHRAPDLILLDVSMPRTDGLTFLGALRSEPRWKDVPVVMVTALNDTATIERAFRLGVSGYWVKSRFNWHDVGNRLRAHLRPQ
ncbi:MAG: response regulator [Tepidisphaeraceae bacterium]